MQGASFFDTNTEPLSQRVAAGLSKLGLALKQRAWQAAEEQGLTPTQGQVLALLRTRSGVRLAEVARQLGVSAPTASDSVCALVYKGLVAKQRDASDGRAVVLRLTAEGLRQAERASGWPDFLGAAVEALSVPEQRVLFVSLMKMIHLLQERGEVAVSRLCVTCRYFRPRVYAHVDKPHHCALVGAPFGEQHLRLDCPVQQPADPALAQHNWQRFLRVG